MNTNTALASDSVLKRFGIWQSTKTLWNPIVTKTLWHPIVPHNSLDTKLASDTKFATTTKNLPDGLDVKVSLSSAGNPQSKSRSNHTSDLKIGILMAALPDARCYGVSAWIAWPGASVLWANLER